MYFTANNK